VRSRRLAIAGVVVVGLTLAGCVATSGTRGADIARAVVSQLPNSSRPEPAGTWLRDFETREQTGSGTGNVIAPTWHDGLWSNWGPSSAAYTVGTRGSHVVMDIAMLAIGPDQAGLSGKPASSFMCVHVVLDPGRSAAMTNTRCPDDVRDRAARVSTDPTPEILKQPLHSVADGIYRPR